MIKIIYILIFSFLFSYDYSDKYYKSMDRALEMFESSKTEADYLKASNLFYRISNAVKTDWLSSYYYALCNARISRFQDDNDIKDIYLDKALDIINPYSIIDSTNLDSLAHSEINTLKALIYAAKISSMSSAMKYGPLSGSSLEIALKFYPNNPRAYFLDGQGKYYMPSFVGGGMDIALPLLEKALKYYNDFKAKKYWPNWGKEDCQLLYDKGLNVESK
jgi:hypothetical protein